MLDKVFMIDRPNEILLSVKIKPDIKRGDTILFADHWRSSGYPSGWRSENRMAIVQKVNKETVWIL